MRSVLALAAVAQQAYISTCFSVDPRDAAHGSVNVGLAPAHGNVEPSVLPDNYQKQLRDVQRGVEELKVPGAAQQVQQQAQVTSTGSLAPCSFIAGLVNAKLSPRCCTSVQVISQQHLSEYGLSQDCQPGWECKADHKTPTQAFEAKSLSQFCGEPGCLPRVTKAMRQSWRTEAGAHQISNICSRLGYLSNADPATVSSLLRGGQDPGEDTDNDSKWNKTSCKKDICCKGKDCKAEKEKLCEITKNTTHPCYSHCCDSPMCFPGEALVDVEGRGSVSLAKIGVGDRILVESSGQLVYEPILAFLHASRRSSEREMTYVTVTHGRGEFRASSTHLVFVLSQQRTWVSKSVGNLQIGDQLLAASGTPDVPLASSRVVATRLTAGYSGMFAPLTASGTAVVDGVVASNYASPSSDKHLSHGLAHAFLLPVRIYHKLGFAVMLKPLWAWLCSTDRAEGVPWHCQGGGVAQGDAEQEDLHPFLTVMYKMLKLDSLLFTQSQS